MHFLQYFLLLVGFLVNELNGAPTTTSTTTIEAAPDNSRTGKSLYYDYLQSNDYNYELDDNDYVAVGLDDNDISRTITSRRRIKPNTFNSPIYYIRLPPQPYMFVPGLGYISQQPPPPPSPMSPFVNLPVSFVSNGKPSTIYQWAGGIGSFPTEPPPLPPKPQRIPQKRPDSSIHRLPGQYTFNGKPEDIFVLRDSYNSLYGDALTNFYP